MKKNGLLFLILLLVVPTGKAHGWGAVYEWCMTHQEIDKQAYLLLQQDPAFKNSNFPSLPDILSYEGVRSVFNEKVFDMTGLGPGPDAMHASPYSWHYYNPLASKEKGKAPVAVSVQFYFFLSPENQERIKGACWAAHFLADMSVPYHVVGIPREEAVHHALNRQDLLSENDTGPLLLYGALMREQQTPAQGWGLLHNFAEATRFYINNMASEEADWYDPWYANGYGFFGSHKVGTSSHVLWEYAANRHFDMANYPHAEGRYNPVWTNAEPNYEFADDYIAINQSGQAAAFTAQVAAFTRNRIADIHQNPGMGLNNAIRNVATLWRASISGLRPHLSVFKNQGQPNSYRIECLIRNHADDEAFNPAVQLTLRDNKTQWIYSHQLSGCIAPDGQERVVFNVQVDPDKSYEVTARIVAGYRIPDLQYATVSTKFVSRTTAAEAPPPTPQPPAVPVPPRPAESAKPEYTLWQGGLDKSQQQAVLRKKTGGKYYERYDADEMILKFNRKGHPIELVGVVGRTIAIVVTGKDYEIRYKFETVYTPKGKASNGELIVDRLTKKTTTTTTTKSTNQHEPKTSIEKFHDPNCKLKVLQKEAASKNHLVILPHGSSNAPDVPWRLHQVSP